MAVLSAAQRAEREAFVSGLEGGSIWEVAAITCVPPALCLASRLVRARTLERGALGGRDGSKAGGGPAASGAFAREGRLSLAVEFAAVVLPFLWVLTTEARVAPAVIAAALAVSAPLLLLGGFGSRQTERMENGHERGPRRKLVEKGASTRKDRPVTPKRALLPSPEPSGEGSPPAGSGNGRWSIAAAREAPGARRSGSGGASSDRGATGDLTDPAESSPASPLPFVRRSRLASSVSSSLALHRGSLGLATALCILAVDFPAFPRRFAKTETRGISIMDLGVGAVVAAGGFGKGLRAGSRAGARASEGERGDRGASVGRPFRLRRWALQTSALIALGAARTVVTRALGYQLHVGEYGLHWNFFLTLACLSVFGQASHAVGERAKRALDATSRRLPWRGVTAWLCVQSSRSPLPVVKAALLLALHAVALPSSGLLAWAAREPRPAGVLAANREGIASLPGFFVIRLASEWIGEFVGGGGGGRDGAGSARRSPIPSWRLLGCTLGLWLGAALAAACSGPPSRAHADAAYAFAVLATSCTSWAAFDAAQAAAGGGSDSGAQGEGRDHCSGGNSAEAEAQSAACLFSLSPLLSGIARRPLSFFLAANVLTGLVNLTSDPLHAGATACRATLLAYALVLGGVAAIGAET